MSGFRPEYLILHDYGGTPKGEAPFNPYHALISGGRKIYRDPNNPYGAPASHAFKLNPKSIGLSWGGPVGGRPSEDDLRLLREEVAEIKRRYPDIKIMSHGEAYAATKGTPEQASRDGRGLEEAAWRRYLDGTGPMPETAPPPVAARGITSYAGMAPPKAETPAPMPADAAPTPTPETPMDPMMIIASLFGGGKAPVGGSGAPATPGLPFGLGGAQRKEGGQADPLASIPELDSPLANMQRKPMDLSALMQLAATKRRGGIG